jgi:hypothetical protein
MQRRSTLFLRMLVPALLVPLGLLGLGCDPQFDDILPPENGEDDGDPMDDFGEEGQPEPDSCGLVFEACVVEANGDLMLIEVCEAELEHCINPCPQPEPEPCWSQYEICVSVAVCDEDLWQCELQLQECIGQPPPDECQLQYEGCISMAQTMEDYAACDEQLNQCYGWPPDMCQIAFEDCLAQGVDPLVCEEQLNQCYGWIPPDDCQVQLDECYQVAQTMEEFAACEQAFQECVGQPEPDPDPQPNPCDELLAECLAQAQTDEEVQACMDQLAMCY